MIDRRVAPLAERGSAMVSLLPGLALVAPIGGAVPQVVAASFPVSDLSGEMAVLVKLVRVLYLAPVVLVASLLARRWRRDADAGAARPPLVPWGSSPASSRWRPCAPSV